MKHYDSGTLSDPTLPRGSILMGVVAALCSAAIVVFVGHAIWRAVFG